LANPKKFHEWGVKARTAEELRQQGLIYIENGIRDENGRKFRFVINADDVVPIFKSPKELIMYRIGKPSVLCLHTKNPGEYTKKYIEWGEKYKHRDDDKEYNGFHEHPTCRSRSPWYALPSLEPSRILLPMHFDKRLFFAISSKPVLCDAALYMVYTKTMVSYEKLFLYMNSTVFLITLELYGMRMGEGDLQIKVNFYEDIPVPDLRKLSIEFDIKRFLSRAPLPYYEEIKQQDRFELDRAVLRALGFNEKELDRLVDELHKAFVEVVEDRLIK
ncbi:MAG: hypothetical protein RMJ30_07755, partial [Nitrososphaerota archaeon]|nr:hypothetical protein [Nitrososphaerota archaeon]